MTGVLVGLGVIFASLKICVICASQSEYNEGMHAAYCIV